VSAHDDEMAQHGISVRDGWLRGGGIRVGESAWGRLDARRVREGNDEGKKCSKVGAFTPTRSHTAGRP
jgi:hypothetical protein